jgi:GWxTD domain-containing protein
VAEKYEHMSASQRHALEDYLWDRSDPLYLSDVNEVYVAHLARVLFADLMFGDPSRRRWGSDTDRGTILVRYGPPHSEWQLARDGGKEMSETEIASAYAIMKDGDGASDPLNINQTSWHHGGGRWIFFNYGTDQPSFVFAKQLRWREVRHIGDSYSSQWANELREMDPARYVPSFPVEELPVQVARFRGESEGEVEVDFYSAMPSTQSGITDDSLQVGLFAFDENYRRVIEQRRVIATHKSSTPVTFSVPMLLGKYSVSVEGRGVAGAAVYRDSLVVGRFPPDSLSMSDLVIAYTVTPRVRNPAERRDFAIQTNQRLTLARNDLLALYWELYGLGLDDEGLAHYLVTITIEGSGGEQAGLARIVRAIGVALGVAGERESPELRYERVARPVDGRAMEYMDLHVDFEKPGEYTVFMRIVDLNSQMEKEIKRTVLISEG